MGPAAPVNVQAADVAASTTLSKEVRRAEALARVQEYNARLAELKALFAAQLEKGEISERQYNEWVEIIDRPRRASAAPPA